VDEIARCARGGRFKGLKLHFGNSRVDVLNNEHVDNLRRVFRALGALSPSGSQGGYDSGNPAKAGDSVRKFVNYSHCLTVTASIRQFE